MKKLERTLAATALLSMLATGLPVVAAVETTGNGAPSGAHYNLNIIGVSKGKTADMTGSNGHVIFVPLYGKAKIELQEGSEFAVLDANATDGAARFQLPAPGLDPYVIGGDMTGVDTTSDYSVFVRPLGKPGGWANIRTCADLVDSTFAGLLSGDMIDVLNEEGAFGGNCSIEQVGQEITMRAKGKSTFTNVTAELLTIVFEVTVDTDADGIADATEMVRVPIFSDIVENEYWEYDNNGLKLLQARFYPVGTDVTYADLLI